MSAALSSRTLEENRQPRRSVRRSQFISDPERQHEQYCGSINKVFTLPCELLRQTAFFPDSDIPGYMKQKGMPPVKHTNILVIASCAVLLQNNFLITAKNWKLDCTMFLTHAITLGLSKSSSGKISLQMTDSGGELHYVSIRRLSTSFKSLRSVKMFVLKYFYSARMHYYIDQK